VHNIVRAAPSLIGAIFGRSFLGFSFLICHPERSEGSAFGHLKFFADVYNGSNVFRIHPIQPVA
jgi:hypothetical protein